MADDQEDIQEEIAVEPAPIAPNIRFHIDFDSYQEKNRSFDFFLRTRMCEESRAQLGRTVEARVPVEDPGSKTVRFVTRTERYGEDPVAVIRDCCSRKPEYRNQTLPLKEVLFRILLAEGNRPQSAADLQEAASEWVGYEYGGDISPETIVRVMELDDYYGFAAVPDQVDAEAIAVSDPRGGG